MADSDAMSRPPLHFLAAALPPLVLAGLLAAWGVDLPYWDQFALVPHFVDRAAGSFEIWDLWTPHNEHRLFVPQAIMIALASWSDWNVLWELWFQFGLAVATLGLLLSLLRTRVEAAPTGAVLLVSLMAFSPVQWRNWIWGWQIQIFLVVLSTVAVAWLLSRLRTPWLRMVSASVAALVGSLSFANGLLLWPLALPLVAFGGPGRRVDRPETQEGRGRVAWAQALFWLAAGALTWAVYFHGFVPSVDPASEEGLWRQILHFGAYVVLYLAAPVLRFHDQTALWGGFVLVSLVLAILLSSGLRATVQAVKARDDRALRRGLPWWTLSSFAVASATVTALGRLDLGIGQALSPRYVTIGNLFWLGLVGWLAAAGLPSFSAGWKRAPGRAFAALLLINAAHGVYHFERDSGARSDLRRQILAAESPEELRAVPLQFIHPSAEEAARYFETLRELELGPYRR